MTNIIQCYSCKGKGHTLDIGCLMIPVVGWLIALAERNDPSGASREECRICDGKGYRKIT